MGLNLGYGARIYPKLWAGLETDKPIGLPLTLTEAFDFLKEQAWILQDAGYTVIVPAWWTPSGRQKAKIRLQASTKKSSSSSSKNEKGYFNLDTIIQYQYQLAIGNEVVTPQEWQQLLSAKVPLVKFRGEWVELDQNQMEKMLEFWQNNNQKNPEMSLLEFMQKSTQEIEMFEVEHDESLAQMMAKLTDYNQLELTDNPENFQGDLREYQKRGVSWLKFLEQLGLNGCLADDMGLGKTVQVIAHLVQEKNENKQLLPTLLIAPTSVVGNWYKEVEKFAPHLRVMIHHGSSRIAEEKTFKNEAINYDLIITSFTLARKDLKLLNQVKWQRHVFHFDRWWNPAVENQATDRAFRIGQKKNVFVHKFVTLGTLEERIDLMIEDKKKIAEAIVTSDESWLTELDNDSFKELIALNRQAII